MEHAVLKGENLKTFSELKGFIAFFDAEDK